MGILTSILYGMNANAVINDEKCINLGTVYESFVAQELKAHGFKLFYYDNKKKGEVEFIIDDHNRLSVMPIEVKSGKDYKIHSALDGFISTLDYHISSAIVLSNERSIELKDGILYMPIYYSMFIRGTESKDLILTLCSLNVIEVSCRRRPDIQSAHRGVISVWRTDPGRCSAWCRTWFRCIS